MKKTRLLLLLVLLMTAATGAWAQEEVLLTTVTTTGMSTYSQSPDGVVTVVVSGNDTYDADWGWYRLDEGTATITVTAAEGYTITRCVFKQYPSDNPIRVLEDDQAPFVMTINGAGIGFGSCFVEASDGQRNGPGSMDGASVIEVYGYADTPATSTYTVTLKAETADEGNWTAKAGEGAYQELPLEGVAAGTAVSVKYNGTKKVKSVKAVKKAAAPVPVTYTALSGGEVLHVGDIIEIPDGQEWRINNSYIMSSRNPLTVVRANITFDQWDEVTVTEAADGAYYVIKDTGGWYYCTYEGFTLPVTGTSDGIYVTYNGILWDEYPDYTFSVHEP